MIRLKNVSKYYYSKGVVATGFSRVNLEFNLGEFVAITGESGSGKTTLLNVISGLDTYEDGEMYINGEETSHYIAKDFEEYRRKNIGNIYQNFNLVNSYTVYQNIALVLMLNGEKNIKSKVIDLIKKVDLYKFRNTKVSKLSGGQKQRVAIARALAKDVPIIIADEPTGNLDKKSALSTMKLLSELSKDKLVIVVTHNYEQVAPYVTRKITMHDGRVLEDVKIKPYEKANYNSIVKIHNISLFDRIRLGLRNTFNIIPKFVLLFLVFSFIVGALMGEYSAFKKEEMIYNNSGANFVFRDTSVNRIVIKKNDNTIFTADEIKKIDNIKNVNYIIENDLLVDSTVSMGDKSYEYCFETFVLPLSVCDEKLSYGRMPNAPNEIIIKVDKDDYQFKNQKEYALSRDYYFLDDNSVVVDDSYGVKIVGIIYSENSDYYSTKIYASDEVMNKLKYDIHKKFSNIVVKFQGKKYKNVTYSNEFKVVPSDRVPVGEAYISQGLNYLCPKDQCLWTTFDITNENLYYKDTKNFTVSKLYNKDNISNYITIPNYDKNNFDSEWNGKVFINVNDYKSLFDKGTFQMSVYVKDANKIDDTVKELKKMNLKTLKISDTLVNDGFVELMKVFKTVTTIILVVTLFFISYFIIKLILKSRNKYYSTIRMLGGTKGVTRELLMIELLTDANLAYFFFLILILLNNVGLIHVNVAGDVYKYFVFKDYIILYLIIVGISILSSARYSRKLFKNSVMLTFGEEV